MNCVEKTMMKSAFEGLISLNQGFNCKLPWMCVVRKGTYTIIKTTFNLKKLLRKSHYRPNTCFHFLTLPFIILLISFSSNSGSYLHSSYDVPGTVPSTSNILCSLLLQQHCKLSIITTQCRDEEMKAQTDYVTLPGQTQVCGKIWTRAVWLQSLNHQHVGNTVSFVLKQLPTTPFD